MERFEWIEPEEATKARHEQQKAEMRKGKRGVSLCALVVAVALVTLLKLCHYDLRDVMIVIVTTGIIWPCLLFMVAAEAHQKAEPDARQYTLYEDSRQWERLRSFDISNHPALPNIRSLTLRQKEQHDLKLDFRAGQLDEAELRTFIESRIAEQRARRLMRRIKT